MTIFKSFQIILPSMPEEEMDVLDDKKCKIKLREDGTIVMDCKAEFSPQMVGMMKKLSNIAQEQEKNKKIRDLE